MKPGKSKPKTKTSTPRKGRPQAGHAHEDAREALLKAAVYLFAENGFSGTSVKDIADRAGVNVSLVSYHFDGKEGLYRICIEDFGKNRLAATERILQPAATHEEFRVRLEMFIDDMIVWFEEEPELCTIVQREAEMGFKITRDVFEQTFLKTFNTFEAFIKAAQTKGLLRRDADVSIASRFFFIGFIHATKQDEHMKQLFGAQVQGPTYHKKLKTQLSQIFFEGLQAKDKVTK